MDEFCREKGIKREYSVARTPRQNGVAERKNRTLIEAAKNNVSKTRSYLVYTSSQQDTGWYCNAIWKDAFILLVMKHQAIIVDAQIQDKDRLQDENDATEKSHEDSSLKDNVTLIKTLYCQP
ncbi:putative ribonuclease H-like domain-containing protein [Tanacetum coccineum]